MRWLDQPRNHLLTLVDPAYPACLRELPNPPPRCSCTATRTLGTPRSWRHRRQPQPEQRRTTQRPPCVRRPSGRHRTGDRQRAGHRHRCRCPRGALAVEGLTLAVTGTGSIACTRRRTASWPTDIAMNGLWSRNSDRHTAAAGQLPAPQPDPGRPVARHAGGRGRARRLADHRRLAAEAGREVFAIPGTDPQPAGARLPRADPRRRQTGRDRRARPRRPLLRRPGSARATRWFRRPGRPGRHWIRSTSRCWTPWDSTRRPPTNWSPEPASRRRSVVHASVARNAGSCIIRARWTVHASLNLPRVNPYPAFDGGNIPAGYRDAPPAVLQRRPIPEPPPGRLP